MPHSTECGQWIVEIKTKQNMSVSEMWVLRCVSGVSREEMNKGWVCKELAWF